MCSHLQLIHILFVPANCVLIILQLQLKAWNLHQHLSIAKMIFSFSILNKHHFWWLLNGFQDVNGLLFVDLRSQIPHRAFWEALLYPRCGRPCSHLLPSNVLRAVYWGFSHALWTLLGAGRILLPVAQQKQRKDVETTRWRWCQHTCLGGGKLVVFHPQQVIGRRFGLALFSCPHHENPHRCERLQLPNRSVHQFSADLFPSAGLGSGPKCSCCSFDSVPSVFAELSHSYEALEMFWSWKLMGIGQQVYSEIYEFTCHLLSMKGTILLGACTY